MTKQLENEKERLIDKKRNEQEERQRKQLELERILEDNRRLVIALYCCLLFCTAKARLAITILCNAAAAAADEC